MAKKIYLQKMFHFFMNKKFIKNNFIKILKYLKVKQKIIMHLLITHSFFVEI